MPIRKHSRKLSGGRRRSGRKVSGGRKVRTGPRGGKYVLRAGKKVYLSGGRACSRRNEKKDPKCEEEPGCKWEKGRKPGCFDPLKSKKPAAAAAAKKKKPAKKKEPAAAKKKKPAEKKKPAAAESKKSKKQEAINDTKLMNELAIYDDRGNFIGEEDDDGNWSNEAYFRDLFKSTRLDLSMTHGTSQIRVSGVQITSDDGLAIARDPYTGRVWPAKTLAFIFNNLKHFKRLKELTLDNGRDYDQRWINNTQSPDFMYVTGKRPSKLKKLVISGFKDVPSPFTNGLDELLIRTNIAKVPRWERDQPFTNVHENISKVVFDGFNKQSYDTDGSIRGLTRTSKQRHDENIAYLKRIFPDSEIVFRGDDTEYQLDDLKYLPDMRYDGTFVYYTRDNLPDTGRRGPREPWNA